MEDNKTQERFKPEWKEAVIQRIYQMGLTQEQVAEELGISQARVSKIIKTDSMFFTLSQLASLADMMHISIDTLMGRNTSGYAMDALDNILSFFIKLDEIMPLRAQHDAVKTTLTLKWSSTLGKALEEYCNIKYHPDIPENIKTLALHAWTQKKMEEFKKIKSTQDKEDADFRKGFSHPELAT